MVREVRSKCIEENFLQVYRLFLDRSLVEELAILHQLGERENNGIILTYTIPTGRRWMYLAFHVELLKASYFRKVDVY